MDWEALVMKLEPTIFQVNCREKLREMLSGYGVDVELTWVHGRSEGYFVGRFCVEGKEVEAYVYRDEAGFMVNDSDWSILEKPDFLNEDELIQGFLCSIQALIEGASIGNDKKERRGVLTRFAEWLLLKR